MRLTHSQYTQNERKWRHVRDPGSRAPGKARTKTGTNQKLWRRSQANKNRCVGIFKRRDIIFNRLHFPILIKFMLCDTSWTNTVHVFSFVALSFKVFTLYVLTEHRTIPVKVLVRSLILLLYPENSEMWPGDVILTFQ